MPISSEKASPMQDDRIERVLDAESQLATDVAKNAAGIEHLGQRMSNIENALDMMINKIDRLTNKPAQWGNLIAGVMLLGTVILLYTTPISKKVDELADAMVTHQASPGHTGALIQNAVVAEQINTLREAGDAARDRDARMLQLLDEHKSWMALNSNIDATQTEKIAEMEREHMRYRDGLEAVQRNRWTSVEGLANRDRIAAIEAREAAMSAQLSALAELVAAMREEQIRRTQRVYERDGGP